MLIVEVEELRPGMRLAAPVQHPERPEQELLRRGYVVQEEVLARLLALGLTTVCVDCPGLDDLDRHLEPFLTPPRRQMYGQIKNALELAQRGTMAKIPFRSYHDSIRALITSLVAQGPNAVFLEQVGRLGRDSVAHATSVAHLALLLGIRLDYYLIHERKRLSPYHAKDVVNLGLAGMLHDIGKSALPAALRDKHEFSDFESESQRREYQSHAHVGYELVHASVEPSAASAVLNHHQHFDGTGFPQRVCSDGMLRQPDGQAVHVFSRILQAADLFHRLNERHAKLKYSNLVTLHEMRSDYAAWCDPTVLYALHGITPPFPPGLGVRLSDGTDAVVIQVEPHRPFQPLVRRLVGEQHQIDPTLVDLSKPGMPAVERVGRTGVAEYLPAAPLLAA